MLKENTAQYLKGNGIKPSYQRIRVFDYLFNNKIHPTVDTIYKALLPEIPTLSKTTVYNTLDLFVENKVVSQIVIEEYETRYDADTSIHGHFKCTSCGKIYDIPIDPEILSVKALNNFRVKEQHIYFKGTCQNCNN
ncbi:MAG: Fur family transcriptional regulator [Fusobacteriaceae bacterium]